MEPCLLALAAGLLLLPLLPFLPPPALLLVPGLIALAAFWRWRRIGWLALACFCLGAGHSVWRAEVALAQRIPANWEGVPLQATGLVEGLPEPSLPRGVRFRFRPQQVQAAPGGVRTGQGAWQLFSPLPQTPLPGSRCRLEVRLKRPHGAANPAGFDYEAWLLSEGVAATGTVRTLDCGPAPPFAVDGLRLRLREEFRRRFPDRSAAGVLLALVSGDRTQVGAAAWADYSTTGIIHLMAISGVHVMLLAGAVSWLLLRLLRRFPALALRWPLQRPPLLAGLAVGVAYSLLAGFSVPTVRTLVMVAVVAVASLAGRRLPPFQILLLALVALLVVAPLAVHGTGFWLSFGAVSILMLVGDAGDATPAWRQAIHLQFAITLLLLPLTLWFFERASWVSPFANLLAVPLVTFGVVPLGLLGFLCWLTGFDSGAGLAWEGGIRLVELLDALMAQFATWPHASTPLALADLSSLLWLVLALACLLQPASRAWRLLGPVFLLPLFWPVPALAGAQLRLTVIDVGQGLSVLVETAGHRLLYDTGPALGPTADAGGRHVLPLLWRRGIYRLDGMVLSHGDLDHVGGAASVLAGIPVGWGLGASPPVPALPAGLSWQPCRAGQHWTWEGWAFDILYPDDEERAMAQSDNNRSCVLRIRRGGDAILLPGDLERPGELSLVDRLPPEELAARVLVLGHHGSRTSTSPSFLAAVRPQWALASAGYRNAFRHPSRQVIGRLEDAGIAWRNTASSGALTLRFDGAGGMALQEWRQVSGHYWQTDDAPAFFANWRGLGALGGGGLNR